MITALREMLGGNPLGLPTHEALLAQAKKLVAETPTYSGKELCPHCGAILTVERMTTDNIPGERSIALFATLNLQCPSCGFKMAVRSLACDVSDNALQVNVHRARDELRSRAKMADIDF